jgi:hypothetical protein
MTIGDVLFWAWLVLVSLACALVIGDRCTSDRECMPAELDARKLADEHREAWRASFDGRPPTDRDLAALADAQRALDCLAE